MFILLTGPNPDVDIMCRSLNVAELWLSLVYVACKQSGQQRLKALQLALKILLTQFK